MEVAQSPGKKPVGLNSQDRELTHQFPEVWAEDNSPPLPRLAKQVLIELIGNRTQTRYNYIRPALGLPDLAKPFTLDVTEKNKVAMGCCPRLWGHGTDQ